MRILSQTELQTFLGVIPARSPFGRRDKALFVFLLNTGLRVAEVAGLDIGHVTESGRPRSVLTLPGAIAKGGRGRLVELNSAACRAVAEILAFHALRGFSVEPGAPLLVTRKTPACRCAPSSTSCRPTAKRPSCRWPLRRIPCVTRPPPSWRAAPTCG